MSSRAEDGGDGESRSTLPSLAPRPARRGGDGPWLTPARLFTLVAVVVGAYAAFAVIHALRTVLVMLLVALFASFAMEPAVQWLDQHGWRRGPATGAVFLAVFLILAGVAAALTTILVGQVRGLVSSVPGVLEALGDRFDSETLDELGRSPALNEQVARVSGDFGARLQNIALGAAGNVVSIGRTAFGLLFQLLSIALVAFYLTADGPRARQALARPLEHDQQREMLAIWELAVAKTGGYIYSRLLLAAAATLATSVFLLVIGVPYPLPLGILVGTTSVFVPVIGTYLGGIIVLVVAFVDQASRGEAPTNVLWTILFLAVYQQVDNYVLSPRVTARTMDVHPAVAFVSVLIGATLLGAVGALLALPAAAIIQALLSTYVRRNELITELANVHLPQEPRERAPSRMSLRTRPARPKAEA